MKSIRLGVIDWFVSVIRYYVPFPQQQHPAISVYNILKQLVGSIRHITKRIIINKKHPTHPGRIHSIRSPLIHFSFASHRMNQRKSSVVHTLDAAAGVTTLHTFLGNNAAVFINSTTAIVSVIRCYVPFHQQQHPAVSVYKLLKQLVGSIRHRHITKRIK